MTSASGSFDFTPLLAAGLPAAAVKWTGAPKYNFVGGNNDTAQIPVAHLLEATTAGARPRGRDVGNLRPQ